ncbi:NADPH-dependent FMN reductase [Mesorhizobium sp. SP-1A]|uniref:NADPH-dependent FMN reductase n=1 Tax=Mesorhizobium sp. SP-1A TaxID=3077840 RepID=UPI0028F6F906|nr:NADPH-dependent FMN reductase [Mesorhizobium sp. SP-1A]
MKHRLNIITGSTRPGRAGPVFAEWLEKFAREHGKFEPVLTDIAAFDLPLIDEPLHPRLGKYEKEHTKAWSKAVDAADAFVFVTPEYNYSAAPAIVNAVDYLLREWQYKPAGFLSYGGVSGGMRAVQATKPLLTTVKVVPIPEAIAIPFYQKTLDEDGAFQPTEPVLASANSMLDELHRWSVALKPMRAPAQ